MKKVVAVAGIIVVAACWPFATGKIGETLYFDAIHAYQNQYVTLKSVSYQRGYLNSTLITKVTVKPEYQSLFETEGLPTRWEVDTKLHHGFLSYRSHSTLADTTDTNAFIHRLWEKTTDPMSLDTTTSLLGNTDFHFKIEPFVIKQAEGVWHVAAVTSTGKVARDGQTDATLMVPRIHYQGQVNGMITINAMDMHLNGHDDKGFWIGEQSISFGDMSWLDSVTQAATTFSDVRLSMINHLETQNKTSSPLITNDNELHIRRIQNANGQTFNNLNIKLSLADVDYNAISTLSGVTHQFSQPWDNGDNEQAESAIHALVNSGLKLKISQCEVSTPQGQVSGNMVLSLLKNANADGVIMQPMSVLKQMKGNLMLSVPIALVDNTPLLKQRVQPLLQQGILEQEGENYTLNVIMKGDKLILSSGMQVPIGLLMMMLM
jgi:uncharacterized protein YdgA (DUF945 family)